MATPDLISHEGRAEALFNVNRFPKEEDLVPFSSPPSMLPEISEEQLAEREGLCRDIITCIRHEEFGIGIELDSEQQRVAVKQREREGRGIKRLSLELYSKDTHFVLELIQNADDNTYSQECFRHGDSGSVLGVPSLKFIIHKNEIIVLNNEIGFSEKNVRAICDVGRSTKSASRSGYIGQKGIGFKSVFRITNTPAIHSNGFHIRFDATSDPIGFILPHWFSQTEQEDIPEDFKRFVIVVSITIINHYYYCCCC